MRPGKRTARLIREAAILGYARGVMHGRATDWDEPHPKDSLVLRNVLRDARSFRDLYPTLATVEWDDTTKWPAP